MSDELNTFQHGFKAGYEEGYKAAVADMNKKVESVKIHDPGEIDEVFERAYGHAVYRSMKKSHEFK